MPLTEEQRKAFPELRAVYASGELPFGSFLSFEQRAHLPEAGIPHDITARVEIALPLSTPFPFLDDDILKKHERVPLFYYSLRSENPAPSSPGDTKVIFYLHGGANLFCHPTDVPYVEWCAAILRALAAEDKGPCIIIAPCYRLATIPENTFPAALQDILAAYDFVISQGYKPSNITLAGDSAGGNHALSLTHLALQSNRPLPNGIVAIAPFSMQDYDNFSEYAKAQASADLLALPLYRIATTAYIGSSGLAPTDPLISGSFIPFTESWPKTLIMVGGADQLIDASRGLEKRLAALKRPVELVEYDERPHVWWLHASVFPEEVKDATKRVARFVLG